MPMENSRDEMAAAFASLSNEGGSDTGAAPAAPAPEPSREAPAAAPTGQPRDVPTGRWAPNTPAQDNLEGAPGAAGAPTPGAAPVAAPGTAPQAPKPGETRAPATWKPEEREGWEAMAPHHRAAIARRELEVAQVLSRTADARRLHDEFNQLTSPYAADFQRLGATPMQGYADYLRTAQALNSDRHNDKAALLADLIMHHKINLEMLDGHLTSRLSGRPGPQPGPAEAILRQIDDRMKPVMDFMRTVQTNQQGQTSNVETELRTQYETFMSDPANEFAGDVAEDMADLLEAAAKRGRALSLQDAYKAATLAHPTISDIVRKRNSPDPAQQTAAARRARDAAASIPQHSGGAPAQGGEGEGDGSLRSDMMSSIRELSATRR